VQFKVPGDEQVYDLVQRLMFAEGEAYEKVVGLTMARVESMEQEDRPLRAMRASIWISMKRKNPTLAFAELEDREFSEIEYVPEDDDERALLASAEGDESVGPTSLATDPAADSTSTATLSPASD
jgi:hypothetical protein